VGFFDWWYAPVGSLNKETHHGLNSLVVLGVWILWKMRNHTVFNGALPRIDEVLLAQEEADLWMLAGAKGLSGRLLLDLVVNSGLVCWCGRPIIRMGEM
jgi:hypothetical protein